MIASAPIHILFLHGMFCPPQGYEVDMMPELLQKLCNCGCQITFIESEHMSNSIPPPILNDLMPSQVEQISASNLPEWYNSCDLTDGSGLKSLDGLANAVNQVRKFIESHNKTFDMVMGHSQGAQLTAILTFM